MANNKILGTFVGKCCDSQVANNNGMYLSRDLFDTIINSDEYKKAMKNRYYIGFLGHPEDPNDMNFKNACIVMTDMKMEDNGDITGSFDLVDTPVGQVVKSFIDAGVTFGISIRGAGDVANDGTVDPDSFVFRGFDLVTFPAYPDCVPEFQAIAASEDVEKQKKYHKVCNTLKRNLSKINSCESLEIIKEQFNSNSPEYCTIDDRIKDINDIEDQKVYISVLEQKVEGLTNLLLEEKNKYRALQSKNETLSNTIKCSKRIRNRARSITASQNLDMLNMIKELEDKNSILRDRIAASIRVNKELKNQLSDVSNRNKTLISASTNLKNKIKSLEEEKNTITKENLFFRKKVQASETEIQGKEDSIDSLNSRVHETVEANKELKKKLSNLESRNQKLQSSVKSSEQVLQEYQQAYAESCANAVGVNIDNIPVSSSTTVKELREYIYGSASPYSTVLHKTEDNDESDVEDTVEIPDSIDEALGNLVTL